MAYKHQCNVCRNGFESAQPNAKFCSTNCRRQNENTRWGRTGANNIASATVGAMSEMSVAVDMMNKGYAVFRALSPACLCDLIAFKDGVFLRVEVRTGYKAESGFISYPKPKGDLGRQEIYGVFVRASKEVFYFDTDSNKKEI